MFINIKNVAIFIFRLIFSLFYNKKYLKGKWFDYRLDGWHWCWKVLIDQKIKGYNRHIPFPVNPTTVVGCLDNITFDIDNIDNFWKTGVYFQCWHGRITIGKGTWIAQNVGLITENHNLHNLSIHSEPQDIVIGENCWLGMNAVILPGVHIASHTIVAAGAVVTHSFVESNIIIGGIPARKIKSLSNELEN